MLHGFIRDFFLLLDKAIYSILSVIFQLIVDLANFRLFSNDAITSFSNRIYLILGIVMVFKLMISFIQMLINPDNMVDKEKGLSGILKRVVISLILIVMVRPIFDFARQLQEKLLPIIPKVIIAGRADVFNNDEVTTTAGNLLSYQTFTAFFYPYSQECQGMSHLSGIGDDSNATIGSVSDITSEEANMKGCSANPEDGYVYRYQYGISTIVGAFLIYVLVTIALKVAIRAIKLSLCEILAPIPIASYIDPKTSKQSFDKWVETSVKTYLDLFTRLAVVYFIIYVFDLIFTAPDGGISLFQNLVGQYKDFGRASLVAVFIIIGLLYFAKEMPKFITSMLGVPEGFTDIGDMFKGQGWKALGGAAGMAAAPISTALSNYNFSRIKGEGRINALRRAAGGLVGGAARSTIAVANGKGWKGTREARDTAFANSRRRVNTARLRLDDRQRYQDEYTPVEYRDAFKTIDEQIRHEQQVMDIARQNGDNTQFEIAKQNIEKYENVRKQKQEELEAYRSGKTFTPPAGSIRGRIQDAWTDFSGTPLPTSQSYSQAASLMKSGKNDIFNQAKTKVAERPDLIKEQITLKDADGNAVTLKYRDSNGNIISFDKAKFSDVYDAYKALQEGRRITTKGFEGMNRSQLEAIYGNIWKDAAAKYVDGVNNNTIENTSMKNAINQWQMKFDNETIITAADRNAVSSKIAKVGYGSFFKSSDDVGAGYDTKAMRLKATEEAKKGDKS